MHRYFVCVVAVGIFGILSGCGPEGEVGSKRFAITNGSPDGEAHSYVGLAVMSNADGEPLWRCSGTLISPTVFLTAGHCTEPPAARAQIWFEEDVEAGRPENGYPYGGPTSSAGTVYLHPQYNPNAFFLYDLGVIVLDEPRAMPAYGALPTEGILAKKTGNEITTLTAVGYGMQKSSPVASHDLAYRVRLKADLRVINLNGIVKGFGVLLSNNADTGGTCFGDSGGPQFLYGTNIVVAVTSFGLNGNCAGTGGGYRVDMPDDLSWLNTQFGGQL